jgi:hypothetical protein
MAAPSVTAWQPVVSDAAGAIGHFYTVSQPTNVTGVLALLPPTGMPAAGSGTLSWNASADTLSWRGGPSVVVNPASSASYDLPEPGSGSDLIAVVTAGALPTSSASDALTVAVASATAGFANENAPSVHNSAVLDGDVYLGLYDRGAGLGQVWRSADGVNWVKAAADSFGQVSCHTNSSTGICHVDSFMVFNGDLYAGTDGGQIWRTGDGTLWTYVTTLPLGDNITALATFRGDLYANQAGNSEGGVFGTSDGVNWQPMYTYPEPQDKYVESLEAFNNDALYSDAGSYNGYFGAGAGAIVSSTSGGLNTWRGSGPNGLSGFGDNGNTDISGLAVFDGGLYAGTFNSTQGAQVWRTVDGSTWRQVATDGFTDPNNTYIHALIVFNNERYAGTQDDTEGGEIWRSSNGTRWSLANVPGFGTGRQMRIRSFFTLAGYLYANAENDCYPFGFTGCMQYGWELWRLEGI